MFDAQKGNTYNKYFTFVNVNWGDNSPRAGFNSGGLI
jgi:hypothetical protein